MKGPLKMIVVDIAKKDPLPTLHLQLQGAHGLGALGLGVSALRMLSEILPMPDNIEFFTIFLENIQEEIEGIKQGVKIGCMELPFFVVVEGIELKKRIIGPFYRDAKTFEKITSYKGVPLTNDIETLMTEH